MITFPRHVGRADVPARAGYSRATPYNDLAGHARWGRPAGAEPRARVEGRMALGIVLLIIGTIFLL